MGLLQNGFRDTTGVFRFFGATASNNAYPSSNWGGYARTGAIRNLTAGQGITDDKVGLPSGNRHPNVWMMPQKAGALAARNSVTGTGDVSDADVWAVKLAEAAISGSGDLTATGSLVVQLVAATTGSGTVSAADIKAFLQLAAALSGSGVAAGTATGRGALLAALTGASSLSPTLTGTGALDADLVVTGTGLTTANVGEAVWQQLIEAGYSAEQLLRIIAAGVAGETTGVGTSTEVYKGVDGATSRITTTFDLNNNRDTVTLDGG